MHNRFSPRALLLIALTLSIAGCTNSLVDSLAVAPTSQSLAVGQTVQLTATGTTGHGSGHPSTTSDVTDTATWTSSSPAVATVSSTGLATALTAGTTTITASIQGYTGTISASAALTVTGSSGTSGSAAVSSLAILPTSQSVAEPSQTTQFIAIGTTPTGATVNLTNQVAWSSSSTQIATIGASTGLATALTQGTVTVIALYTSGGNTIAGTASFSVANGSTEKYTAVTLVPSSQSISASGQTGQFIALATSGTTGLEVDVTNSSQTTWTSSVPTIASITSGLASGNGVITGASQGGTTITAEVKNSDGSIVSATGAVTVTLTAPPEPLLSLTIIPSTITIGNLQGTGNFLAIGTFSSSPYVEDLTNTVTWLSSAPQVFPVSTNNSGANTGAPGGIVTAYGDGNATIIAEATYPTTGLQGLVQTATATFNCPLVLPDLTSVPPTPGSCFTGSESSGLLVTLTIYNEGVNTTNWLVTAPSATNTPNVVHCGPGWGADGNSGGSVCTATYPLGTTITLTAPAQSGVDFGGWSYNCSPVLAVNAAGPNSCTITLGNAPNGTDNSNVTVGAIFN
ncbi:MAG: Ig-like domain-containing protein [Terracidiphilus sp.]